MIPALFLSLIPSFADHALLVCGGLLAAAALAWPARILLRRDPVTCYRLLFALLVGAVAVVPLQWIAAGRAAPLATPLRDWLRERSKPDAPATRTLERAVPKAREESHGTFLVDTELRSRRGRDAARQVERPSDAEAVPGPESVAWLEAPTPDRASPSEARLASDLRLREEPAAASVATAFGALRETYESLVAKLADRRESLERAAVLVWLAGVGAIVLRRLLRAARTVRLIRRARDVADPDVLSLWRRVGRGSRVADRVRLVESAEVASPACTGLVRRVVVLPAHFHARSGPGSAAATATSAAPIAPGVLEWALRHELVHLERGDHWAALFQSAVTALLWFHPAGWWLSAEIGRLRELSCDQQVVQGSGRRRSYALALLETAASASRIIPAIDADPHSAGVRHALLHWSRSPSQIRRRIEMLTVDPASLPRARKWFGALVAGCALAVPAIAQVAGAATLLPPRPQESTAPAPVAQPSAASIAPVAPVATPVPMPSKSSRAAVLPSPRVDDVAPASAPPRARRHVSLPAGLVAPRAAPPNAPVQDAAAPVAPATPAVGVATTVRVGGGEDDEDLDESDDDDFGDVADCSAVGDDDCDSDCEDACDSACAASCEGECEGEGEGEDESGPGRRAAQIVQERMKVARRQIEQAVRQVQRGQVQRQRDLERELGQVARQADRFKTQSAQRRDSLQSRLAEAGDDDRRAQLESELTHLEAANQRQVSDCDARCEELQRGLAALQQLDFSECQQDLAALDEATVRDARNVQQAVQAELLAERSALNAGQGDRLKALGYLKEQEGEGGGDGDGNRRRDVKVAVERALQASRAATERACAQAADAVARAQASGALDAATKQTIEKALAQARKVDVEKIRREVESELRAAQSGAMKVRAAAARTPAPPMRPRTARAAKLPESSDAVPSPGPLPEPMTAPARSRAGGRSSGSREEQLQDRIKLLEEQIEVMRAELEAVRQQSPAAPPARHGRALR